jgi:hypothetical protein
MFSPEMSQTILTLLLVVSAVGKIDLGEMEESAYIL